MSVIILYMFFFLTRSSVFRYDEQLREQQNVQKEDFSDMVAEHAARQQKVSKSCTRNVFQPRFFEHLL